MISRNCASRHTGDGIAHSNCGTSWASDGIVAGRVVVILKPSAHLVERILHLTGKTMLKNYIPQKSLDGHGGLTENILPSGDPDGRVEMDIGIVVRSVAVLWYSVVF